MLNKKKTTFATIFYLSMRFFVERKKKNEHFSNNLFVPLCKGEESDLNGNVLFFETDFRGER